MDKNHIILLVSNDPLITQQLAEKLVSEGYGTLYARDLDTIVQEVIISHPEVVIIDLASLDIDGFAIFESVRSHSNSEVAQIPIIVASQNGDIMEIGRAVHLGAKDYFIKSSHSLDQILGKVQSVIGGTPFKSSSSVSASSRKDPSQIKLLIIEDDAFLRELAEQKFAKENFQVIAAVDGEQGMQLAEKIIPHIILLDILLPGIDGYEVLRRVRSHPDLVNTRVIMLSNFGQREDIEKAMQGGANKFLIKANYTINEIVDEVMKLS